MVLSLLILLSAGVASQDAACVGCSIQRTAVATLGREPDSVYMSTHTVPMRTSTGKYVTLDFARTRLMLFDSSGKLERTAGKQGDAPGELGRALTIRLGIGDSIFIEQRTRVDVFGPNLDFARWFELPTGIRGISNMLQLRSGHIVTFWSNNSSADFLHTLTATGAHVASFGASRNSAPGCSLCRVRVLAQGSPADEFIGLSPGDYRVEVWGADGINRREFRVLSSWFPATPVQAPASPQSPQPPRIVGAWLDEGGRLWIAGHITNDKWQYVEPEGLIRIGGATAVPLDAPRTRTLFGSEGFTTVVDVIDLATGSTIASTRYEGESLYLQSGGYLINRRELRVGVLSVDVSKLELRRPGPPH